jgi:hypothetical protein
MESVPEFLHSPATHPWWVLSLLKFARVSLEGCEHRSWTLSYCRAEWGRENKLLAVCTSYIGNCPFHSFVLLFIGLLIFWEFSFWAPCIFWLLIFCQMYSWQRFSPFCRLSLHSVSFAVQSPFTLMHSNLSILSLICWAMEVLFWQLLLRPRF